MSFYSNKWRNITVSGKAASGSTTLARGLAEKTGWKMFSGGEMVREYMKKNGISLAETNKSPDEFHVKLDNFIKDKLKNESQRIIESWLAGYDAIGIAGVFKILVVCEDDSVRIDRLVNRDKMTIEKAKEHLRIREKENMEKWEKLYKTADFWNPVNYDLVIDTYRNGPLQTLETALESLGYSSL